MTRLPARPALSTSDWSVVRRIYRKVFWHGRDPNGLRTMWSLWLWGLFGSFLAYHYRWSFPGLLGALIATAVIGRVSWRAGHQEGYEVGFDEGFERGWFGAHGIDWTRDDLYDEPE